MRPQDPLYKPGDHSGLSNVSSDQHHPKPTSISFSDTTTSVPPLPGGPAAVDVAVPYDTEAVIFSLRAPHQTEMAGASAGVTGVADRVSLNTSAVSVGGHGVLTTASYNAVYSKASGAINLSHKVFDSALSVALTDAYLVDLGGGSRVFRMYFVNYGGASATLSVYGELGLL